MRRDNTKVTFADYLTYTAPPGMRDELLHGEIIFSPAANRRHQDICHQIVKLLEQIIRPEFVVRQDTTINLTGWQGKEGPCPDVFVIDRQRWVEADQHGGYPVGSPQLVVEVKSPSNNLSELEDKAALFLAEGALAVWIVDLEDWCLTSYVSDSSQQTRWLKGMRVDVPPELSQTKHGSLSVSEIFDGIVQ